MQDVKISLTAYDPSRACGRLDGTVQGISADALTDNQSGSQYYFNDKNIGSYSNPTGSEMVITRVYSLLLMFCLASALH